MNRETCRDWSSTRYTDQFFVTIIDFFVNRRENRPLKKKRIKTRQTFTWRTFTGWCSRGTGDLCLINRGPHAAYVRRMTFSRCIFFFRTISQSSSHGSWTGQCLRASTVSVFRTFRFSSFSLWRSSRNKKINSSFAALLYQIHLKSP